MKKIFGRKPVLEYLLSGKDIDVIYFGHDQKNNIVFKIIKEAKKRGVKTSQISSYKIKDLAKGQNSQGVIAIISDQKYFELDEIISSSKKSEYPLLLILDSIQDVHNLGAILRTAECAGVDGVVMTSRESAPISETVNKTSAGAVSHLKICRVNNLVQSLKELKKQGYWIVGSSLGKDSKEYTKIDYKIPIALVLGNEEKGIKKLTADTCDHLVNIPMLGKIQSLNVSVSAGILLFEVLKQRN